MFPIRYAAIVLMAFALAACEQKPAAKPASQAPEPAEVGDTAAPAATAVSADEFMAGLALDFPHQVTNQRRVRQKGGGRADVIAIDYTEGSVRTIDRQMAAALRAAGFERGERTVVPGGVRVAYEAQDGRRVSTMIRNKKYLGDRVAETSAGQVSLSYVAN
ncbi:hypothetical protein [Lysobacter sp. A3-1-A15]|uniref:hypothetical protein n=1 Tax=Novilysobacter viscosus TaxID=3098602 RepID=UPI002EDA730A